MQSEPNNRSDLAVTCLFPSMVLVALVAFYVASPITLRSHTPALLTGTATCRVIVEDEDAYRRSDFDCTGILEYAPIDDHPNSRVDNPADGSIELLDKAFAVAGED
jgi:hypothetical protein